MSQESADLRFEVEEALISLSRAVSASGGDGLVMVADDAVAPLAVKLGLEYAEPPLLETIHERERRPGPVALLLHRELEGEVR